MALADQVERLRTTYNGIRPHEALGFLTPMALYLAEPNLFEAESVQKS